MRSTRMLNFPLYIIKNKVKHSVQSIWNPVPPLIHENDAKIMIHKWRAGSHEDTNSIPCPTESYYSVQSYRTATNLQPSARYLQPRIFITSASSLSQSGRERKLAHPVSLPPLLPFYKASSHPLPSIPDAS